MSHKNDKLTHFKPSSICPDPVIRGRIRPDHNSYAGTRRNRYSHGDTDLNEDGYTDSDPSSSDYESPLRFRDKNAKARNHVPPRQNARTFGNIKQTKDKNYDPEEQDFSVKPQETIVVKKSRSDGLILRNFDGQTTSWKTFLTHFTTCAKYNGWSEVDKLAYLKNSLRGDAEHVICEDEDREWSF